MSGSLGSLEPDVRHLYRDRSVEPEKPVEPDHPTDAGAWPEGVDIRYVADGSMTLPGMGNRPESCGTWYPKQFCAECGEPHFGESRCENRHCPNCWGAWSRRRSESITRRLGAARYAADDDLGKRAVHTVASPPEGDVRTLTDVQQGFRDAYELAREKGVRGGVAIFHGYRVKEKARTVWNAEKEAGKTEGGLWKWVREHSRDWRSLTYWSPHWHILGLARDVGANDPDSQDGWVFKRIRSLKSFKLTGKSGYADTVGASMYTLSHMAFEPESGKDMVRWFGELSTAKFSPESELSDGALATVERYAAEAAAVDPQESENDESDEPDICERGGCAGELRPIWEAGRALMDKEFCEKVGREQQRRLSAAFEWMIGERHPPPGLRYPDSKERGEEALQEML